MIDALKNETTEKTPEQEKWENQTATIKNGHFYDVETVYYAFRCLSDMFYDCDKGYETRAGKYGRFFLLFAEKMKPMIDAF